MIGILGSWAFFALVSSAPARAEPWPLLPEAPATHELKAGELHIYRADLAVGELWRVVVEQQGIDIAVQVVAPDGTHLGPVDSPLDRHGAEFLLIATETEGSYLIEVQAREPRAPKGSYQIHLEPLVDDLHLAAETARMQAAQHYAGNRRREALDAYRVSLHHWRALGKVRQATRELYCVAVLERLVSKFKEALNSSQEVLIEWQRLGDRYWEAATLNEIGLNFGTLDDPIQAREFFHQALALRQTLGDVRGVVTARNNICRTFLLAGALRRGLECYRPIFDELDRLEEPRLEANLLINVAWTQNRLGEPDPALETYGRALELMRQAGDPKGEAQVLNNLGALYRILGQPEDALAHYEPALKLFRQLDDLRWQGTVLNNIGHQYVELAEPQRGLAFLRQALQRRRTAGHRSGEMLTLRSLGQVHKLLGEDQLALEFFQQNRELAQELGNPMQEAIALKQIAATELSMGSPRAALTHARSALELLRTQGDRNEAEIQHHIGRAQTRLGEPQEALASLQQALTLYRAAQNQGGESEALAALARAERQLGRHEQAKARLEKALRLIETLRTRVKSADLRASAQAAQRSTYDLYIDVLMKLHRSDPAAGHHLTALEASERARARSLLDLLNEGSGDLRQGVDPALLDEHRTLRRRLNAKALRQEAIFRRQPSPEEALAELDLASVLHRLDLVEAKIRETSPHFAALTQPQPLDAPSIQKLLDPDTVLLEFALGEERSVLWWVTPQEITAFELPPRATIEELVRQVHDGWSDFNTQARQREALQAAALSQMLLGPVAERLIKQRLVTVADGALHYLPFAALPQPPPRGEEDSAVAPPLLIQHEVVHLPSASVLAVQRRELGERPPAAKWLVAVADPVFDAGDARLSASSPSKASSPSDPLERSAARETLSKFRRLSASRREARAITALAAPGQASALLGFEANREAILEQGLRHHRVVHFATHGVINAQTPRLSGLVLSLFDENSRPQQGFLRLHDIYELRLDADLVVLSGCQTALGKAIRGEGLVGLTRGFMHAGAPRVVASLWRVEDRATAELMTRFYRAMSVEKQRPAAALRQAQLSIREERRWKDPYFWSAFLLMGEWSPLPPTAHVQD